ncbi:hypothetical protein HAV15_001947 [Penicillium sp. str. |nr:hypothetical protein HAV15_001947 [Penicillium sp. str. \
MSVNVDENATFRHPVARAAIAPPGAYFVLGSTSPCRKDLLHQKNQQLGPCLYPRNALYQINPSALN